MPAPKASARIIRAHDDTVTATLDSIENKLLETRNWDPSTRKRPRIKGHGSSGGHVPTRRQPQSPSPVPHPYRCSTT